MWSFAKDHSPSQQAEKIWSDMLIPGEISNKVMLPVLGVPEPGYHNLYVVDMHM